MFYHGRNDYFRMDKTEESANIVKHIHHDDIDPVLDEHFIKPFFCPIYTDQKSINYEDLTLIWLDAHHNESVNNLLPRTVKLREKINSLQLFQECTPCEDFIHSAVNEHIFLIISGSFGRVLVPQVHHLAQISCIFVFCADKVMHSSWAQNFIKIKGVFNNDDELMRALIKNVDIYSTFSESMCVFNADTLETSIRNLTSDQVIFMWNHLLIETLLRFSPSKKDKQDFLDLSRSHYKDNSVTLKQIDDFEENYTPEKAITWYTRDSFVYRILNKALRTQNIDMIFQMRFIIIDLYKQLEILCQKQFPPSGSILTIYRGQFLPADELAKIHNNVGHLISMNSFISTTTDCSVAVDFAGNGEGQPLLESILFEINMNTMIHRASRPFAKLHEKSYMNNEKEILLSMDTVFRIDSVELATDTIWHVRLTIVDNDFKELQNLNACLTQNLPASTSILDLANLLHQIGEFLRAERYCKLLLSTSELTPASIADVYDLLCHIYVSIGDFDQAKLYAQKGLDINERDLPHNSPWRLLMDDDDDDDNPSPQLNWVSNPENSMELSVDISPIMEYVGKQITSRTPAIANSHRSLGNVYHRLGNHCLALLHFEHSLCIDRQILHPMHAILATDYSNLASTYYSLGAANTALLNHQKALEIDLASLPANHPSLAHSYNCIGLDFLELNRWDDAFDCFTKAKNIYSLCLPPNHYHHVELLNNIGLCYYHQGETELALSNFEQALSDSITSFPANHLDIAQIHHNLGSAYSRRREYPLAFMHATKAVEIGMVVLSFIHPNLMIFQEMMNNIKEKLQQETCATPTIV